MDTIAAIATPPGQGGIGIIRVSGPLAKPILNKLFEAAGSSFQDFVPWRLHYGHVVGRDRARLDECLAVFMPAPHTFTREDVAEIHCHGNNLLCNLILGEAVALGARLAERGEFSRRAFLNGRIDLSQAEAIAELANAQGRSAIRYCLQRLDGELGRKVAALAQTLNGVRVLACADLDFTSDETGELGAEEFELQIEAVLKQINELLRASERANLVQHGKLAVLAGPANAGKSSLLNWLAGRERALVSPMAGTTRDFIEVQLDLEGIPLTLVDTAGLRDGEEAELGAIELQGIQKSEDLLGQADLVLVVVDGADPRIENGRLSGIYGQILKRIASTPHILIWNKCDVSSPPADMAWDAPLIVVSALTGRNMEQLAALIRKKLCAEGEPEDALAPNFRQSQALRQAASDLESLRNDLAQGIALDCCLARLDSAVASLGDVVGVCPHDELLNEIFAKFCVGK